METEKRHRISAAVSPSYVSDGNVEGGKGQEKLFWYPMRATYGRELQVKEFLATIGIESFVPMQLVRPVGKHPRNSKLVPAINNLIFVHSRQEVITELKMTRQEASALRYMMRPEYGIDGEHKVSRILTVPDKQMESFIKVASVDDERVFYMQNMEFVGKPGQRVRIVEGQFNGVEGIIKRVKKNKCVVVQIEGVVAVAIAFVPQAFLLRIDENGNEII